MPMDVSKPEPPVDVIASPKPTPKRSHPGYSMAQLTSELWTKTDPETKTTWVQAAGRAGMPLAHWVIETLNAGAAAERESNLSPKRAAPARKPHNALRKTRKGGGK